VRNTDNIWLPHRYTAEVTIGTAGGREATVCRKGREREK